jgi:hypothetical protein
MVVDILMQAHKNHFFKGFKGSLGQLKNDYSPFNKPKSKCPRLKEM